MTQITQERPTDGSVTKTKIELNESYYFDERAGALIEKLIQTD